MFKTCTLCGTTWDNREDFLDDERVALVGYQADFTDLKLGYFLFNHECRTTLSVHAGLFFDLYNGEIFNGSMRGTAECPEYCLHKSDLRPCPAACECAFVREIIGIIRDRERSRAAATG